MRQVLVFILLMAMASGCRSLPRSPELASTIARIEAIRLRAHVEALAAHGPRSWTSIEGTLRGAAYIEKQLLDAGLEVQREMVGVRCWTERGAYELYNVVGTIRGQREAERVLEVCAHYDTVEGSPGADDDASGVAGMLEIARVLADSKPARTLRFVFFCLEEFGKHGSEFHVSRARERGDRIEGALILEMIGYSTSAPDSQRTPLRIPFLVSPPRTGDFIVVVGNLDSGGLGRDFELAIERYVPELDYFSVNRLGGMFGDASRSDHEAYWNHGYRGIMITDTANFRNPHYHQSSDTPATLDYAFLRRVAMAASATLLEWASEREPTR